MEQSYGQIFVYGSLRSGFHHPAYEYNSRYFSLVTDGKIKGGLFDMGEYPAAVPTDTESFIIGELYVIKHPDEFSWAIAQLDDYEGLNTENNEPPLFKREITTIYLAGETTNAWVYWFNGDVAGRPYISHGDVLLYMHQKNQI